MCVSGFACFLVVFSSRGVELEPIILCKLFKEKKSGVKL